MFHEKKNDKQIRFDCTAFGIKKMNYGDQGEVTFTLFGHVSV